MAKKKYLGMLFITGFMFLLLFLPGSRAFAAASGSWGNAADQVLTLDDNGKLTISGSGELESLKGLEKDLVREVVIEPGVRSCPETRSLSGSCIGCTSTGSPERKNSADG